MPPDRDAFNLAHATFKQALVHAKLVSGMINEEISEVSGISLAQVARYFQEHDAYAPSPALIKPLCRAMGNTILADWVQAQAEGMRPTESIRNAQDLTLTVMRATERNGELNRKAMDAVADGIVTPEEARVLQAQFRAMGESSLRAADALESLAIAEHPAGAVSWAKQ